MRIALPLSRFVAEASAIAPALAVISGYAACSLAYGIAGVARRMAGPLLALSMAFPASPVRAAEPIIAEDWATAPAHAPFSRSDTVRQTALTALFVVDAGQTIDGLSRVSEGYHETNPLLRDRTPNAVRGYFAGAALGSYLLTRAIAPQYRPLFQYSLISLEAIVIVRNRRFGLHYSKQF